jgi:hypothetical protein
MSTMGLSTTTTPALRSGIMTSKLPNSPNSRFCGVSIGPLRSFVGDDPHEVTKGRKIVTGEHASGRDEVLCQIAWPHQMLDAVVCSDPPEYMNLSAIQFAAGYSAIILSQLPQEMNNSVSANQLKHFNRLFTLAMKSEWDSILKFNRSFFRSIEQRSNNWEEWDRIKDWHSRNLDSLTVSSMVSKAENPNKNPKFPKDGDKAKKDELCEGVPMGFIKSNKLCKKFQSGVCDQTAPHALPSGTMLSHSCAMCLYKKLGLAHDHGAKACTKKQIFGAGGGRGVPISG